MSRPYMLWTNLGARGLRSKTEELTVLFPAIDIARVDPLVVKYTSIEHLASLMKILVGARCRGLANTYGS